MLTKIRNSAFALAAATAVIASSVQAQSTTEEEEVVVVEHEVIFIQGSYFPVITKAAPGDTIRFVNKNAYYSHTIYGRDGAWTSGRLYPEDDFVLVVTADTPLKFGGSYGSRTVRGQIDQSN